MTFLLFAKIFASIITGMLGIPLGILPSIFLFRDLANGVDTSEQTKRSYDFTLWSGMAIGWLLASVASWTIINFVFS